MVAGNVTHVAINNADTQTIGVSVSFEGPRLFVSVVARPGRETSDTVGTILTRSQCNECLAQCIGRD